MVELDLMHITAPGRAHAWQEWHAGLFQDRIRLGPPPGWTSAGGFIRGVKLGHFGLYRLRTAFGLVRHGSFADDAREPERHGAGSYAVVLLLSGACSVAQDGRINSLGAGDMVFLHSGRPFEKMMEIGSELILFTAPIGLVTAHLPGALSLVNRPFRHGEPGTAMLSRLLTDALETCARLTSQQCQQMMRLLLDGLQLPAHASVPACGRDESRIRRAIEFLDASVFDAGFTVDTLARQMCISRRRLDEIFVDQLGRPVAPLIWERRLERAADMLGSPLASESTITDIALAVGFENASHFSRSFKNHFATTPLAWRRTARARRPDG